jgi:hypothetical protein
MPRTGLTSSCLGLRFQSRPNARPESSSSDGSAIYRPLLERLDFILEPNNGSTVGVEPYRLREHAGRDFRV